MSLWWIFEKWLKALTEKTAEWDWTPLTRTAQRRWMNARRSSAAGLEFIAWQRDKRMKMQCEEMWKNRGMNEWHGGKWIWVKERGLWFREREWAATIRHNGAFCHPSATAPPTLPPCRTHTKLSLPQGAVAHARCRADRLKEIDRDVGLVCQRHAAGSVCPACEGAMLAAAEGAVCVCAQLECTQRVRGVWVRASSQRGGEPRCAAAAALPACVWVSVSICVRGGGERRGRRGMTPGRGSGS